jgi:hypothetical protein
LWYLLEELQQQLAGRETTEAGAEGGGVGVPRGGKGRWRRKGEEIRWERQEEVGDTAWLFGDTEEAGLLEDRRTAAAAAVRSPERGSISFLSVFDIFFRRHLERVSYLIHPK